MAATLTCALALRTCLAQEDSVGLAVAALERGDYSSAEQIMQARLRIQPKDSAALAVLGVVLDQEKKYAEAAEVYRRALANSPPDPALLNNFGNHLLATGKPAEARKAFLQVIGLDARNANALVQLARIALERKAAAEALGYLDRIPPAAQDRPDAVILRMQADYRVGRQQDGDAILTRLSSATGTDPGQSFALGVALASVGQYEKAETFFSKSLEAVPTHFEALYDLGVAASHAGHNERARSVLEQALAQQPENVDVLYDLAAVNVALDDKEPALQLLAKAARLAPQRTDILQLEARTSAALGYFADAVHGWDAYLKLAPTDDVARRERAFAETATGEKMTDSLAELNTFVRKHPGDAAGHYELGTAETPLQPEQALKELDRALALTPDLTGAHVARGLLLYQQGKPAAALADFEFVAQKEPKNGAILDRLGETYMALDRTSNALPVLRKAAGLLPLNSTVLLHLGRALSKTGQPAEAAAVFARSRELGPNRSTPHPAGLVEFLGLSPDEQRARYRAGVEHTVQSYPDNVEAQVRYLGILLEDGKTGDAAAVVQTLSSLKVAASLLTEAVRTLLASGQYLLAKQLLDRSASAASPGLALELTLDLALADFHLAGASTGLDVLSRIPQPQWNGDYYLARAEMLEAQGRGQEGALAVNQAIRANPTRPDLYRQAALLLIKNDHLAEAVQLLAPAARTASNDPEILLLQALALELAGSHGSSDSQFKQIENRWPEWYKVWIANALVLEARQQPEEARSMRQAAIALGAPAELVNLGQRSPALASGRLAATLQVLFP